MYQLDLLKPIVTQDLVRIGRNEDGGYVLNQRLLDKTETLISFGISNEWSFESDFYSRKKSDSFRMLAFDYSVNSGIFIKKSLECIGLFIKKRSWKYLAYSLFHLKKWLQFLIFFHQKGIYFFQKGIDDTRHNAFVTWDYVFDQLKAQASSGIFIKMDIEGYEYKVLPGLLKWPDSVLGFVVEFHELELKGEEFNSLITGIYKAGYLITHIHANNWGGYIPGTSLPRFLEITFAKKSFFNPKETESGPASSYPMERLDYPCFRNLEELSLHFGAEIAGENTYDSH